MSVVALVKDHLPSKRKRLNLQEKRLAKAAEIQLFAKQYARPAQKRVEPNDRRYHRGIEEQVKRMRPGTLDELLRS